MHAQFRSSDSTQRIGALILLVLCAGPIAMELNRTAGDRVIIAGTVKLLDLSMVLAGLALIAAALGRHMTTLHRESRTVRTHRHLLGLALFSRVLPVDGIQRMRTRDVYAGTRGRSARVGQHYILELKTRQRMSTLRPVRELNIYTPDQGSPPLEPAEFWAIVNDMGIRS